MKFSTSPSKTESHVSMYNLLFMVKDELIEELPLRGDPLYEFQWLCHASHGHVRSSVSLDISRKAGGLSVLGAYRSSESLLIEKTLNNYSCL
ncbi:hypothetical protein VNO77_08400 [Canavalia gladiata]|uniref:Uncharacterized protein n=1 Tax=Canavalia gladiata TaxID=3824 RepID=A0AAN9M8I3_CANGL